MKIHKKIVRYSHLYRVYCAQFAKVIMQSNIDFSLGLIGFAFTQLSGIAFLYLVFTQIPAIEGWSLEQLIFIYGFAQIPRGVDHLLTDNLWTLSYSMVINGEFDRYMVRPVNILFQVISEKIQPDAIGELLVGILLVGYSTKNGVITFSLINILLMIVSIVAGAVIYTAVKLFFASLSFWVKQSGPFLKTAYDTAEFAKYPISMYSKVIQVVLMWVIPFAFVAYIPATYFIQGVSVVRTIGGEVVISVIAFTIAYVVMKIGLKRYESAGN